MSLKNILDNKKRIIGMTICEISICTKRSNFNYPENKRGRFCSIHKLEGMINVMSNKCMYENCNVDPSFNFPENKKGRFCNAHKLTGMINVKSKKCIYEGCNKQPNCNMIGEKPIYCITHKLDGMINLKVDICMNEECTKICYYNYSDKKKPEYCNEHKLPGMIDVKHLLCFNEQCNKRCNFNYSDEKSPKYCSIHKLPGMVDVTHNTCIFDKCNIQSTYNYPDDKTPKYCSFHKLSGMVDVRDNRCKFDTCNIQCNYNYPDRKIAIYCNSHKLPGMIDVKNIKCKFNECTTRVSSDKYSGYCVRCFIHQFPDKAVSRNYKIKEKHVTDYLSENFPNYNLQIDKRTGGCSLRRPDVFIDMVTYIIIIEIDELQHKQLYYTSCDIQRLNELFEDFGYKPIVFIKFNVDQYKNNNGEKKKSCFTICKSSGIQIICREEKKRWNERLNVLKCCIKKHISETPKDTIFEYLYYDDYDDHK